MTAKKPPEEHKPRGRPTKYKEEYCQKMIDFFSIEHTYEKEMTRINKDGSLTSWMEEKPNRLPTFELFAVKEIGVAVDTLQEWKNKRDENGELVHPNFSVAYTKCKNLQKAMINNLGMLGLYSAAYTKFVAINITDMQDTQHVQAETKNVVNTVVVTQEEIEKEEAEMEQEFEEND